MGNKLLPRAVTIAASPNQYGYESKSQYFTALLHSLLFPFSIHLSRMRQHLLRTTLRPLLRVKSSLSKLTSPHRCQHTEGAGSSILSKEFGLDSAWEERSRQLQHMNLGDPNEWMVRQGCLSIQRTYSIILYGYRWPLPKSLSAVEWLGKALGRIGFCLSCVDHPHAFKLS